MLARNQVTMAIIMAAAMLAVSLAQEANSSPWQQLTDSVTSITQEQTANDVVPAGSAGDAVVSASERRRRRKNRYRQRLRNREKADDTFGADYDYYYDRDDSYGSPKAPVSGYDAPATSYDAPASSYDSPSYSPSPSYHSPSYHDDGYGGGGGGGNGYESTNNLGQWAGRGEQVKGQRTAGQRRVSDNEKAPTTGLANLLLGVGGGTGGKGGKGGKGCHGYGCDYFNDFLNALAAFLPIGLFLAAIPPNLITINTSYGGQQQGNNDALANFANTLATILPLGLLLAALVPTTVTLVPGSGRKRRDINDDDEGDKETRQIFLEEILDIGFDNLKDPDCQKFMFCQMAVYGGYSDDANSVQRTFFSVARRSPKFLADMFGVSDVVDSVVEGDCTKFKCHYY